MSPSSIEIVGTVRDLDRLQRVLSKAGCRSERLHLLQAHDPAVMMELIRLPITLDIAKCILTFLQTYKMILVTRYGASKSSIRANFSLHKTQEHLKMSAGFILERDTRPTAAIKPKKKKR